MCGYPVFAVGDVGFHCQKAGLAEVYCFIEAADEAEVFAFGSASGVMGVSADLFAFFFGDTEGDACVFLSGAFGCFVGSAAVCHGLCICGCFGWYMYVFAGFSSGFVGYFCVLRVFLRIEF